jgi:hypothetical protein
MPGINIDRRGFYVEPLPECANHTRFLEACEGDLATAVK